MPQTLTYPGVYIEEVPSGVRTITGVATSITAFVGRAARGPVSEPTTISSFADFERAFGGLWPDSAMSYAVRDFYANGGSQAIIVRLAKSATRAVIPLPTNALTLAAKSAGTWGNNLSATVDHETKDPTDTDLFNLTVSEAGGATERLLNLSIVSTDARFAPRVLGQSSNLVRVQNDVVNARPDAVSTSATPNSGNDGAVLTAADFTGQGMQDNKTGIYALEKVDLFNLLCLPPFERGGDMAVTVYQDAMAYCASRRAMLLVDPPAAWSANKETAADAVVAGLSALGLTGDGARNAALYFPPLIEADPLREGHLDTFVPCGAVAAVMARTDAQRGVWKAPAGLDATLNSTQGLAVNLTDQDNGRLNPVGVNCLRSFPVAGRVVWGARTLRGADQMADEYKYVPVRRLALHIEESAFRGTQWVTFEPNDEPLWAQIRLNLGAFMQNLFRQGAFAGRTPREAYFVKCDAETTTQNDINLGIVNILLGFAPLKPAEFVVIKIQQMAGQVQA
jgi:phage tail sheath protein FI